MVAPMGERFPAGFLLPLRLLVGVMLVLSGYNKFTGGWLHGDALLKTLNGWTDAGKTYHFFLPVIETAPPPALMAAVIPTPILLLALVLP